MSNDSMFGNDEGGYMYFSIVQGKFAQRVAEDQATENGVLKPGYRKRELTKGDNAGKSVYEFVCDKITGKIVNVRIDPGAFGTELKMTIEGGAGTVELSSPMMNQDGATLQSVVASIGDQIGLIDFSQEMTLGLWKKQGKLKGIYFDQNGFIPSYKDNDAFKEHVDDRPDAVKTTGLDGKDQWDFRAPSKWQFEQIKSVVDYFVEQGVGNNPTDVSTADADVNAPKNQPDEVDITDDLPF